MKLRTKEPRLHTQIVKFDRIRRILRPRAIFD